MRLNALRNLLLLFAVALTAPRAVLAAEPDNPPALTVDDVLNHMEDVRKTLKTFKADVVKVRQQPEPLPADKFLGNIEFKTPRLLRLQLENTKTHATIITFVGKEFGWIYRPQQKHAERGRLADLGAKTEAGNPLEYGLARPMSGLREGYKLKLLPAEKIGDADTIPLEMTPEGGANAARGRIIFWIDLKTWLPAQVREYKANDELVETHTFSNVRLNEAISDSTFEFIPPKDVEVELFDAERPRP